MNYVLIAAVLTRDEGKGKAGKAGLPYLDSVNLPTVGIGRNLAEVGLTLVELADIINEGDISAHEILHSLANPDVSVSNGFVKFETIKAYYEVLGGEIALTDEDMANILFGDIERAERGATMLFGENVWYEFPQYVQEVIVQVVFNLGIGTFRKFRKAIAAFTEHDYSEAADELLDSRAARQTGQRYHRYAAVLKTANRDEYEV